MEQLSLNDIIEIYLGNSLIQGMDLNVSKNLAYKEIQKRTVEYRNVNKVSQLVSNLNATLNQLPTIEKTNSITFIDNAYGKEVFKTSKQLELFCIKYFRPHLSVLFSEINDITTKLDKIWKYDPENIRYSSKFFGSNTISQYQEYDSRHDLENILFTKTKIWRYQISVTLRFEYMISIIRKSKESDITFLPLSFIDWDDNRELVFNFITTFNAMTSINSYLWILFLTENQDKNRIEDIIEDIRIFSRKLIIKSGFYFNFMPYTIIKQAKSGDIDFSLLVRDLEEFTNKYIE